MNLQATLRFIVDHPLNRDGRAKALWRFVRWQLQSRALRRPIVLPFAGGTCLVTETGMTGATGNWYCGLHEHDEMGFVLHALRPEDLFVDVGANIGSYTVLAAGAVGASVIAAEPLPRTFAKLLRNIAHNHLEDRVTALCCGLSSEGGELMFTSGRDTMNRIALPGESGPAAKVPVKTLDDICEDRVPQILKIDVEGHEAAVLEGGTNVLASPELRAVLMETNGSGKQFGVSDEDLIERMRGFGFEPCHYDAIERVLSPAGHKSANTIFLRDRAAMQQRCLAAPRYALINGSI